MELTNVVRSHNVFIQTQNKNSDSSTYQYKVELPESLIKVDDPGNQIIRLTLLSFTMPFNYPQINGDNNTIIINDIYNNISKTISLPPGNYQYSKIRDYVNNQWGSPIMSWDISQLKFIFQTSTIIKITFLGTSYNTFGFNSNDNNITGRYIISSCVLNQQLMKGIYVSVDDLTQGNNAINFDNINVSYFKPSSLLMIIPITCSPWEILYFRDVSYAREFTLDLPVTSLDKFTLSLRDKNGSYLTMLPDYECTIKIEICNLINRDSEAIINSLQGITRQLKEMKLYNYLQNFQPEVPQIKVSR